MAGDGTVEELQSAIIELEQMLCQVKTRQLPEKCQRHVRFAWIVIHNWNMQSELGTRLISVADKYKRKLSAGGGARKRHGLARLKRAASS